MKTRPFFAPENVSFLALGETFLVHVISPRGGDGMGCFEAHHSDILNLKIGLGLQGQQQASIAGRSGLPCGFCYPSAMGPWASVSCPFPISGAVVDDSLLCVWGQHLWTLHTGC